MDFTLRLHRRARAPAERGSLARAARTPRLTQPPPGSIQDPERRTGIERFDRHQGRVAKTDRGRVFVARALAVRPLPVPAAMQLVAPPRGRGAPHRAAAG